jgi:hypothetical protein
MAMDRNSGAEKPCSIGDAPPVLLLNRICHRIRVERDSIRAEQAYCKWIRRLIIFPGASLPNIMASQVHSRCRALHMANTSSGSRFHQLLAEKISTSWKPR